MSEGGRAEKACALFVVWRERIKSLAVKCASRETLSNSAKMNQRVLFVYVYTYIYVNVD